MKIEIMSLYQSVEPSFHKLQQRLTKDGIPDLSQMNYEKYLRTVFWKEIKEWVTNRDNFRCVICKAEKSRLCELEVHHRTYDLEVLEGRNSDMLVTLCPRCHKLIEFYADGRKRSCLYEKDEKYLELALVHANLASAGLPVKIDISRRKNSDLFEISYIGNSDFLIFYSLESLMFGFVFDFIYKNQSDVKVPLPFGQDKFYQKSGAKISSKVNGKEVISVKITDGVPTIKATKNSDYPLHDYLLSYISEREYWYVV